MSTKAERAAEAVTEKTRERAFSTLTRDIVRQDRGGADGLRARKVTTALSRERYDALVAGEPGAVINLDEQLAEAKRVQGEAFALVARDKLPAVIDHWNEGVGGLEDDDQVARNAVMAECVELFLEFLADG